MCAPKRFAKTNKLLCHKNAIKLAYVYIVYLCTT